LDEKLRVAQIVRITRAAGEEVVVAVSLLDAMFVLGQLRELVTAGFAFADPDAGYFEAATAAAGADDAVIDWRSTDGRGAKRRRVVRRSMDLGRHEGCSAMADGRQSSNGSKRK